MQTLKKIGKIVAWVSVVLSAISFVSVLAITILVTVDVTLRGFFSSPILGSLEIVQYMLMAFVFASFAYTQVKRGHVRVTILYKYIPWRVRSALAALMELACVVGIYYFMIAAIEQMQHVSTRNVTSDVLGFTLLPFFVLAVISLAVYGVVVLFDGICNIVAIFNREYSDELNEEYS